MRYEGQILPSDCNESAVCWSNLKRVYLRRGYKVAIAPSSTCDLTSDSRHHHLPACSAICISSGISLSPPVLAFTQRYYSRILIPQAITLLGFVRAPLQPTQCSLSQSVIASIETCIVTDGVPVDGRLHRCYSCPTAPACQCFPERHRPILR